MRSIYIIDTNVALYNPHFLHSFTNSEIVIPIVMLEELDKIKIQANEIGKNARVVIRYIDNLIKDKDPISGFKIINNNLFKIETLFKDANNSALYGDIKILHCARKLQNAHKGKRVVVVTRDLNLRIRAKACGLAAEHYERQELAQTELYTGFRTVEDAGLGRQLLERQCIECDAIELREMYPNEFVLFVDKHGAGIAAGRKIKDSICLVTDKCPWNLHMRGKEQLFAANLLMDPTLPLVSLIGMAGTGKAQPLDAKVLTPNGWITMGDIHHGSVVSTPDGKSAAVSMVFPQGSIDIYRMSFSDGTSTECSADHLWLTQTSRDRGYKRQGTVKTTKQIQDTLLCGKDKRKNHSIPIVQAIEMSEQKLVLDPYNFGCLLGDGSFRYQLNFTSADDYIVQSMENALNKVGLALISVPHRKYHYNIIGLHSRIRTRQPIIASLQGIPIKVYDSVDDVKQDGYSKNTLYKKISKQQPAYGIHWSYGEKQTSSQLHNYLRKHDLWMQTSQDKYIPDEYKYSSVEQRIALLQGLMDADGSIDKTGHIEFTTISPRLAEDVKWLVQSLGGTVVTVSRVTKYTYNNEKRKGKVSYRLYIVMPNEINPFRLPRKRNRVKLRTKYFARRYITNVEYIGQKQAQCILVDSDEHLYITNDCIVTHNTLVSLGSGLEMVLNQRKYSRLLIYRPMQAFGKEIGHLPGSLEEKIGPHFAAVEDSMQFLFSGKSRKQDSWKEQLYQYLDSGVIQQEPLTYIRGRSIPNAFIVIDEAQQLSQEEMKTILTRAGEGSKIVISGDIAQIDRNDLDPINNGLTYAVDKFKQYDVAGHVTFLKGERSELASLAAKIL